MPFATFATVAELRAILNGLPDDMPVTVQAGINGDTYDCEPVLLESDGHVCNIVAEYV